MSLAAAARHDARALGRGDRRRRQVHTGARLSRRGSRVEGRKSRVESRERRVDCSILVDSCVTALSSRECNYSPPRILLPLRAQCNLDPTPPLAAGARPRRRQAPEEKGLLQVLQAQEPPAAEQKPSPALEDQHYSPLHPLTLLHPLIPILYSAHFAIPYHKDPAWESCRFSFLPDYFT